MAVFKISGDPRGVGPCGMMKTQSVPALQALGMDQPSLKYAHKIEMRKTMSLAGGGPGLEKTSERTQPSKAYEIADLLKKPSWRIANAEPRAPPVKDTQSKNMRWPRLQPAWLKHDKHVLRFYGFFQEHVVERWDENCRYRNVIFQLFLEDGTLSVTEPKVENSGLMQGPILKRSPVLRSDGKGLLGPGDFVIGEALPLYGVNYHITGADRFTRWFFEENGWPIGEDLAGNQDQWQKSYSFNKLAEKGGLPMSQSAVEAKQNVAFQLGQPPADLKLIQFLQNDRKVLRFKAFWDDPTMYGNRFYFTIHYFLADNSCEINEAHSRNSGRDAYPVFMKRGPLLKDNRTNVYPGMLEPKADKYLPHDMLVGAEINVWRRKLVIYDCDDFTQKFFEEYLGVDQKSNAIDVADIPKVHVKLTPPPHGAGPAPGYPEDSLMNCVMIRPKAASKDVARLMTLSGEVLRFEARCVNGEPEDENRKFIVGWFPDEHHMACWELKVRNSGHMAGKFSEKKRMTNVDTGEYFKLHELAIGKTLCIAAMPLVIIRADEHTLRYLERNTEEFPSADPRYCAYQLAPLQGHPELQDPRGIEPDRLKDIASEQGIHVLDHEIITLLRNFNIATEGGAPLISGPAVLDTLASLYQQQEEQQEYTDY
jgi:hypothetical protein